jgi:heat shock protein HslJ
MKMLSMFAILALSAAACSSGASTSDTLIGRWDVAAIADSSGALVPLVEATILTANITETEINGSSGCNNYMGPATIDGSTVSFGPMAGTLMACVENDVMEQEQMFLTLLQTADSWEGTSESVDFRTDGTTVLQLVAADTSLAGSSWRVTALNNQSGGVQSVVTDSEPTLVFDEESGVSGSTGCNNFFGIYSTDGDTIEFSGIGATEMYCQDTAEQEVWMIAALADATTYKIDSRTFELFDESGTRLLTASR